MIMPENKFENLEPEKDEDDDISKDDTALEEPAPSVDPEDPLEILKKGREEMKNSEYVKVLKKELKKIKNRHRDLLRIYKLAILSHRANVARTLDENEEE